MSQITSPWLTAQEAADRARVGSKVIYRAVKAGRLRGARVSARRDLRFLPEWVDAWLESTSTPVEVRPVHLIRKQRVAP